MHKLNSDSVKIEIYVTFIYLHIHCKMNMYAHKRFPFDKMFGSVTTCSNVKMIYDEIV